MTLPRIFMLLLLLASPAAAQPAVPLDVAAFDKLAGFYRVSPTIMPGTVVTVSRDGQHFFVKLSRQRTLEIFPESFTSFFMLALPVKISFEVDSVGNASGLIIHQGGHDVPATRIDETTAKAIEALPPPQPKGHMVARTWPMMPGVTPRILTTPDGGRFDYWPCFSPDGRTVLFSRSQDGGKRWSLMQVPAFGGDAVPFGAIPVSATRAEWSRDGKVAFTGSEADGANTVWIADGDGRNAHRLAVNAPYRQLYYPSWYPDGKSLAVMDGDGLSLLRVDMAGGMAMSLTDRSQIMTGMPSVSPDGSTIVFAGQKNTGQRYDQNENFIWMRTANGVATVENPPMQGRAPVWSPDGRRIAFESDRGSPDGHYAVFIVNRDGTGLVQVTDYALNANHPVWSRDGRHMVFVAGDPAKNISTIAVIDFP